VRLRATTIYADAWSLWRADWPILTAVAGMFVFLPRLALSLLVPSFPDTSTVVSADPSDPAFRALVAQVGEWMQHYALPVIGGALIELFGQLALVAIYLAARRATVGQALLTSLRLLPRFVLATLLWQVPMGVLAFLLSPVPFVVVPLLALVVARMLLIAPAILAARPIGAVAAIGRSFRMTRGNMLVLASVALSVIIAQYLIQIPFLAVDQWLVKNGPNPVARLIVDTFVSGAVALAATATALIQVAAWRRLSSS